MSGGAQSVKTFETFSEASRFACSLPTGSVSDFFLVKS